MAWQERFENCVRYSRKAGASLGTFVSKALSPRGLNRTVWPSAAGLHLVRVSTVPRDCPSEPVFAKPHRCVPLRISFSMFVATSCNTSAQNGCKLRARPPCSRPDLFRLSRARRSSCPRCARSPTMRIGNKKQMTFAQHFGRRMLMPSHCLLFLFPGHKES